MGDFKEIIYRTKFGAELGNGICYFLNQQPMDLTEPKCSNNRTAASASLDTLLTCVIAISLFDLNKVINLFVDTLDILD